MSRRRIEPKSPPGSDLASNSAARCTGNSFFSPSIRDAVLAGWDGHYIAEIVKDEYHHVYIFADLKHEQADMAELCGSDILNST